MSNEYTREWWKERLPLIQAFVDKIVEVNSPTISGCEWTRPDYIHFGGDLSNYRIAPEPKLRPWRPEEVPVANAYKSKETGIIYYPASQNNGVVRLLGTCDGVEARMLEYIAEDLLAQFHYTTDGGRTWAPCGVMEEQQ